MNGQDTRRHEWECQNVMGNRQDGMDVKVTFPSYETPPPQFDDTSGMAPPEYRRHVSGALITLPRTRKTRQSGAFSVFGAPLTRTRRNLHPCHHGYGLSRVWARRVTPAGQGCIP